MVPWGEKKKKQIGQRPTVKISGFTVLKIHFILIWFARRPELKVSYLADILEDLYLCRFRNRFLVGNKTDLRDVIRADGLVSQEQAKNFAKTHNMMFFETSAKGTSRPRCVREVPYQRDKVEDIVNAVGARLKRQKNPTAAYNPAYSGSFQVLNKKKEKEMWSCC